jgi:hypothetical protein
MATFDPLSRTITLRIIYDGLGLAGKTTNLRQLHDLLADAHRGDLYIPEERRGRTLYFDWLEVEAGLFEDYRLRCQLLTVPGQFSYVQRRWHLLHAPDAIVAVVDSTPQGLVRARYALRFLEETIAHHQPPIPLIIQANKQDAEGALPGEEVRQHLQLPPHLRLVEASALQGAGVRTTLVFALQGARERLRGVLQDGGVEALSTATETAEELYHKLLHQDLEDTDNKEGEKLADQVLQQLESEPSAAPSLASILPPPAARSASSPADSRPAPSSPPPAAPLSGPSRPAPSSAPPSTRPLSAEPPPPPPPRAVEMPAGQQAPRSLLPTELAPLALWPAAGRVTLGEARESGTPVFHTAREEGGTLLEYRVGPWALLTRPLFTYRDRTQGAVAMRELAEARVAAADLLPSPFILAVQPVPDSRETEIWAIRTALEPAFSPGLPPDEALVAALARYVARALGLAARYGVVLSLDPARLTRHPHGLAALSLPLPLTAWGTAHLAPLHRWARDLPGPQQAAFAAQMMAAIDHEVSAEEQARLDWPAIFHPSDDPPDTLTSPGQV